VAVVRHLEGGAQIAFAKGLQQVTERLVDQFQWGRVAAEAAGKAPVRTEPHPTQSFAAAPEPSPLISPC
jgi:hypothetical protein